MGGKILPSDFYKPVVQPTVPTLPPIKPPNLPSAVIPPHVTQPKLSPQINLPPSVMSPLIPVQLPLSVPNGFQSPPDNTLSTTIKSKDIKKETQIIKKKIKEKLLQEIDNEEIINRIINSINEGNIDAAQIMFHNNQFINPKYISVLIDILKATNEINSKIAIKICKNKNFTNSENVGKIPDILNNTNERTIDLIEQLCTNSKFTNSETITDTYWLIKSLSDRNIDFANWIFQKAIIEQPKVNAFTQLINSMGANGIDFWRKISEGRRLRYIKEIIQDINEENFDFGKWICESLDFGNISNTS